MLPPAGSWPCRRGLLSCIWALLPKWASCRGWTAHRSAKVAVGVGATMIHPSAGGHSVADPLCRQLTAARKEANTVANTKTNTEAK